MRVFAALIGLLLAAPAWAQGPAPVSDPSLAAGLARRLGPGRIIPVVALPGGLAASGLPRVFTPAGPAIGAPALQCRQAIRTTERQFGIPEHLMAAIARVETGRPDAGGVVQPWPWTINAEGTGRYFNTKAEAIAAVVALQKQGVRSIDVGCMQVNLLHHPDAFPNLDAAFDPAANAAYAAGFLIRLKNASGSWAKATADYHSATPELGNDYERRVAAVWPQERAMQASLPAGGPGNVWTNNVWTANAWNTGASPLGGGQMLNNGAAGAHVIPIAAGTAGRGLSAYRASPIPVAGQVIAIPKTPRG